jgi:zinc protease
MPGIAVERALVERLLPLIGKEEIRAVAAEIASEENRVIVAAGHASAVLPEKAELLAAAAAGRARATAAYVDEAGGGDLLSHAPTPGTIARERVIQEIGVTEWRLSNGMTVVLKPTDFQNDSVLVALRTPGGTSRARDADYHSAAMAAEVVAAGGFGEYSAVKLGKRLAGTGVTSGVALRELDASIGGSAPRDQIELLLQLVALQIAEPRRDEKAFASWKAQEIEGLRNQLASPEIAFDHRFASEASGDHLRRRRFTAADYGDVDLDRALTFYRDQFASMRGSTAVLVGAFDVEKVKPLVLAYLGGLPGKGPAPRWRNVGVKRPRGARSFELKQGLEPKAHVRLEFHGPARWSRDNAHELDSLTQALRIRLREELREEMGGVYGVGVDADLDRDPAPEYELGIEFGCAPENREQLIARTRAEIEAFRQNGPPAAVVEKVAAAQRRERETALKDNRFWLRALAEVYRLDLDPRVILDHERLVARLSPKMLRDAARRWFGKNEMLGQLVPQGSAATSP